VRKCIDKLGREGRVIDAKSLAEVGLNGFVVLDPTRYAL
jgi:hypothetical protein